LPEFAIPPSEEKRSGNHAEGKQTPSQQGSIVPLGWRPTVATPLPAVRCTGLIRQGERKGEQCDKWSMIGVTVCFQHGGQLPNVKQAAEDRKQAARLKLIDSSGDAADTIAYLMQFATQENVRLAAAKEVLDRAGIKGGADITIAHEHTLAPSKLLGDKLEEIAKRVLKEREEQYTTITELDIIISEVVPEVIEQDNLTNE
jgi:hypothetical protein